MNIEEQVISKLQRPKFWPIYIVLLIFTLISSIFTIYELILLSSIETLIRYIVIGILVLIDIFFLWKIRNIIKPHPKRKKRHVVLITFMILYTIICSITGGVIYFVYDEISHLNKVYVTYTSHLIVPNGTIDEVSKVKDFKIGILENETSMDGYILPMEIIKENKLEDDNELVSYSDYTSMIVDLYSHDIDACFVSGGYVSLFSSITGYENIATDTKILASKSKRVKKADTSSVETTSTGKDVTEPFTLLLMGIDSVGEDLEANAVANGDTLILITFNPKTLNATMLSIPRDSYVPIACWANKSENKITHAAIYGNDCMIHTIENYFDTKIDYYAKINFRGLVNLVNALGGIEIDVEKELCTDNSNREYEVCISPGLQTLDGEHALVYARNRKQLADGDFGRNYHQQLIIMALLDKIKEIKDVNTFMDIVNTISKSMDTNFTTKQILSFYNIVKDIVNKSLSSEEADVINIERLYLQGDGQMIYDERAKMVLWDYVPNQNSKKDIIRAMKENLELIDYEPIKEFSFSINTPYEKPVIGYGPYTKSSNYVLLPDFTGDSENAASATCKKLGISCTFKGTGGTVISQNYPESTRIDNMKGSLILTLSKNDSKEEDSSTDHTTSSYIKDKDKDKDKSTDKSTDKDKKSTSKENDSDDDTTKDKEVTTEKDSEEKNSKTEDKESSNQSSTTPLDDDDEKE